MSTHPHFNPSPQSYSLRQLRPAAKLCTPRPDLTPTHPHSPLTPRAPSPSTIGAGGCALRTQSLRPARMMIASKA
eukprot:2826309-Pyramimonas_sp.AAC.3